MVLIATQIPLRTEKKHSKLWDCQGGSTCAVEEDVRPSKSLASLWDVAVT